MTVSQAPLSVRNNNPGNLRFVGQEGASPGEGGFARFESPEAGLAAMRNQIELDTQTRGLTLTQFINKYAPPSENKTGNYIDFVVKRTGLDPAGRVPVERIADLQTAMIEMEGGPRALDVFKLQPAKPTAVAKAPEIRMAETRTTQPVAFRGQNLPQSYTTALALNYIADTDPDSKIMEQVNQMMQEMQGGGGNARQIAAALKPLTAEEPEVDPFAIMAQAQQAQAQEDAQRRRVVPRMPVRMANGGSMDKSLLELAAMGQKPYYTAEEKAWIAAREKEYEDYNRQVEDYNRKLEQYKKDAEEYNKAVAPYLSEVEAYNQALKRYQEEVYAPYESEVQSYNKALEDYKANVYNPYLSEIEKYNQALEEYEQNVYNPYVKRVEEYNKALEEYNQQNYPGYDKAVADYNKAAEDYNARLKAYEEYTAKAPEYYIGATAENPVPYVISWNPKYDGYFRAYQGFDPLNPGQLSGSPVQYWADWARGGTPGWSRIPTDYEFVQTATVPVYGEKGNFAAGYFRKTGAPAYGSVTSPGEFTLTAPTAPTPYPVAAPTAPDPFGQAEPTKPEDFNRVAPVQPSPFSMTQPTAPSVTSPLQPTQPGTPQYTQEQFEEYVTGAQGRAKKAAAQRASALSIAANPEQYGLSGFGLSLPFEAGGEVNKADLEAKGEVTITPQQREEYFRNLDQALMRMQMSAGDLSGQLVRTPTGIDVRATTNVAGVRPFVDIDPGRLTVSRYGASYGQMSPQGGYDITVQQQASVPTPVGPVNLPPSLRGTYVRPIGKDATVMVEGTYSPGPQPFYQVGGRYVKRFEKGGAVEQNPADIAEQMTVGTIPEGKSGVLGNVARDVVQGAQYLPYDLLGAPVDIATMAMRPFGYNVEKPVGGSEYLIEKARQAGIAQAPTGSMAETATRIGMGFVNPAAVARQIPKGIAALEKGAETLGTGAVRAITGKPDITPEQIYQAMGDTKGILQLGAPAAVKPGGGVVNADEMIDSLTNVLKFEVKAEGQKFDDIFKWIDTKARSYYEKQFGAPGDPLFRAFMSGDFEPQFKHINDAVRETYESTIKHGRDLMSSTSTADQRVGRAMLSDVYDKVTPVIAQYGPQTIRNRLLNPKFREEIQRYIMEERNLGPAKLTPKARLNYEKEIDSYLDEFAKTGNLSTKAPFDVTDINMAASQNIVDDIGNKVSIQTIKAYNLQPDEMHGFVRQWPGYGTALEKTHALPSAYSKNYPDYLATTAERQAIKFGEPTYSISKQPEEVHADLRNLIGYLNRTPSDEWKNTSFPDLVVKAQKDYSNITDPQEIYKRLNNYQKVTPKQRLIGTQEFMPVESKQLGEGATWRELDENGILIEGRLLRHCLSEDEKYRNFYKNGMSRFFALRDKEGKSYATIQIDRLGMDGPFANVHQIKGWKNDSVGKKYDKELMDFLNRYQANEINVPLRYTEESSFLPLSLTGGERVRVVEGDAPLVLQYVEFFRTLDRNLIDRGMATPEDLGDFNYVLDRIRDLPTEAQQKEFADTFLKAFAEGYNKPLKFIYHLGGWRTGQLGEPQPVWQNPPVNRAKGGMVDKPLYDRAA